MAKRRNLGQLSLGRREFLKLSGASLALSLASLRWAEPASAQPAPPLPSGSAGPATAAYADWQEVYRQRFTWDRRVRCTHVVNCWYQRNCAWDVFVKDGVVLREEQAGEYAPVNDDVPDYNPRGCQKGACYSALVHSPARLRYPLRRVGARGEAQWKRIGWDEALDEIADRLIDAVTESGPETVVLDPGGSLASATWRLGIERIVRMLDGIELDTNTELDDGQGGASITFGTPISSRSADDLFRSDVILIWGANPVYTQIPNAHFINEARYRGATVVTIAPDYSASSVHADLFVPVRPGTDAALALGIARIMLASDRIDHDFVRMQTDLPLLLKSDGRFLRESDIDAGGRGDTFYVLDQTKGSIAAAPKDDLDYGEVVPALDGSTVVWTRKGPETVRPVLSVLRERLERDYSEKRVASICGISPQLLRRLACVIADAGALAGIAGSCIPKFYHGDLIMRAQLLVFMLGGHLGRAGDGFDTCPFLRLDGLDRFGASQFDGLLQKLRLAPKVLRQKIAGESSERALYDLLRDYMETANIVSSVLYWRQHAGMQERTDADWGRGLERPVDDYVRRSFDQQWQRRPPQRGPRVLFVAGSNIVRRLRSSDLMLRNAFPKMDLVVTTDVRMTSTCMHSDILLPGATSYEKDDATNWFTLLSPYLHITQRAIAPIGEAKPEWTIHAMMAQAIERRARARGVRQYLDRAGKTRRLDDFYRRFSKGGRYGPEAQTKVAAEVVEKTSYLDASFEDLRAKGFRRIQGIGGHPINLGNATEVRADQPVINRERRRTQPAPWPTLTRRIQFYIDHPFYLELGEELPVHKEPPLAGGDYPLVLSSGHTRWSIHAGWRNVAPLLHLQRGEAAAFVSLQDAEARTIRDGDEIRVWNDVGEFRVRAKVSAAVRPGTLILYHAWEDYQFSSGRGYRNLLPSPLNPAELAGGYNHLRPVPASLQPGQSDRETRVEIAAT